MASAPVTVVLGVPGSGGDLVVMAKAGAAGCRMSPTTCVGSDRVGGGGACTEHCQPAHAKRWRGHSTGDRGTQLARTAQTAGDNPLPIASPSQHISQPMGSHSSAGQGAQHPLAHPVLGGQWLGGHPEQGPSMPRMAGSHRGLSLALAVVRELRTSFSRVCS